MKKLFQLGVVLLFLGLTAVFGWALSGNQVREDNEHIPEQFVGAWRLAWIEEQGADGNLRRTDRTGILVYTSDGHMSVQIMARESGAPPAAGPVQYEQSGYEAYYGRYDVDERAHSVTHHVEGAYTSFLESNSS